MDSPYADLPARNFWRPSVSDLNPVDWRGLYLKRFDIEPEARIAAAGSCFAQHIGRQLRQRGFNFLDLERPPTLLAPERHADFGYGLYSARYGNIYSARQLLQLFQQAFRQWTPQEGAWMKNGRFHDPFRPSIEPNGFASNEELYVLRKRSHLPAVRDVFLQCDVFVFTLGLTEAWVSTLDGAVFPVCPGVIAGTFDPALHRFHNFGFAEVHADMTAFIQAARSVNPTMKLLLTVSPVPLTATASNQHVLTATTYSKSVLRAVAGALVEEHEFVDYFPSYEIVTAPAMRGMLYAPDMRNVTAAGVDLVMSHFFSEHPAPESATAASEAEALSAMRAAASFEADVEALGAVCDEEKLDPLHT